MTKSYIWSKTNRILHILLIVLFAITYITAEDELLKYHGIVAILFGFIILLRVLWGFIGPKYSKFKDFSFNIKELKSYLTSPFSNTKKHIGHNPASSWAIVFMFLFGFLAITSGMLAYGAEHNHGFFSFLYSDSLKRLEFFEEIHEVIVNLLVAVIAIHVLGTLIDKYIKKNDAIDSMINGYKITQEECSIKTNIFQKLFSILSFILFFIFTYYLVFIPNIFIN